MIDAEYPTVATPEQTPQTAAGRTLVRLGLVVRFSFLVFASVFLIGFVWFTIDVTSMAQPDQSVKADAIVVLTGGTDRLKPAIELLKNGAAKKLLISGVNPGSTKKEIMRPYNVTPKLAECCIDLDPIAKNTIGNATQSAKWLRANRFSSVILVTSNYHMPRAQKELKRLAGRAKIIPYPLVNSDLTNWKWLEQPEAFRLILTEYLKTTLASVRHIIEQQPGKHDLATISG